MTRKNITSKLALLILFCLPFLNLTAQDLKVSQYKAAPTFYNPATTGKFNGISRVTTLYSHQATDSASLHHTLLAGDYKIQQNNGSLGIGLSYYQNFQQNFCLTSRYVSASVAKHFFLDADNYHMISIGGQVTFASGTINSARTSYSKKISGGGFDMSGTPKSETEGYKDLNLGLMYTYKDEDIKIEAGLAAYHTLAPVYTLNGKQSVLARRICATVNTFILLDEDNELELSNMMWREGLSFKSNNQPYIENIYSATWERFVGERTAVYLGISSRSLNSLTPMIGLSLNNNAIRVVGSYEQPVNKKIYNVTRGEVSLVMSM